MVDAAVPRERQFTLWCSELPGFGVYIHPTGRRTYFVDYRNADGVRRRMTIGRHGKITTEEARRLAIATMGETVRGEDPALERATRRSSLTVSELCDNYIAAAERGLIMGKRGRAKKATTLYVDRGRIAAHVKPLLGKKLVRDVSKADIAKFIRDVAAGKTAADRKTGKARSRIIVEGGAGTAARTAGLLGGILSYAVSDGVIDTNPATGVKRPADKRRERRLTPAEYGKLGEALRQAASETEIEQVLAGVNLLALTGCRIGEIAKLKWSEVDEAGQCLRLEDTKEGASVRPAGRAVFDLLATITRRPGCPYVLPAARGGSEFYGALPAGLARIVKRTGLSSVTAHTLRHSYASTAGDLGFSESTIAALLGHAAGTVTSRYVHHLDSVLVAAADRVTDAILAHMARAGE
ncbi:tyrosine-type recombinase/integrase [Ancylobacter sp. 6x-1]|uniref:Tyrosine-type recombinase/integrase n=1 Tax=Ancylobacter crimeensis TaxID=2579147 RepID=A0ABT0DAF4_9HYPH|nr:site-specific integrase [Ancylobacter crimeensis]MCK0196884.1 tyrosine-type recombinase/integrase [Ancylobacter crimeensis]